MNAVAEAPVNTIDTKAGVLNAAAVNQIPLEGDYTVSLGKIDITKYKNYRQEAKEKHILELIGLLKEHGQLNSVLGAWQPDGTIALVAGFCRYEAMERMALEKVIDEYNHAHGHPKPTDEGYVPVGGLGFESRAARLKVREAGGDWLKKYDAALGAANIKVTTTIIEDAADAALKNIASNAYEKPPLMDLCKQIEILMQQPGITAKRVAKALKLNETTVSLHRKINECPKFLRELFAKDLSELAKKPEEQTIVRDTLLTAVAELERRLGLETENPQSISYSHAREFAGAVMHKEPMSLAGVAKALKDLVCMGDNGKISEAGTPEYSVFKAKLNEAKRIGKEPVPAPAAAPAAAPAIPTADLSSLSKEQLEQFDKAAAAQSVPHPAPAAPVSTGNSPAPVAAAPAPASPLPTSTPTVVSAPAMSPAELAKQAEIEAANSEFVGTSTDALLDAEGDAAPIGETLAVDVGQTNKKVTDAPVLSKYKPKPPEKIENAANRMLDYASDTERATPIEQAGYLLASSQLFTMVGMDEASMAVNEAYVNFVEGTNKYLLLLENHVKEKSGEAVLKEIQATRPVYARPQLAK